RRHFRSRKLHERSPTSSATAPRNACATSARGIDHISRGYLVFQCMRDKVIFWGSTAIVSAVMLFSIITFTFYDHFPVSDPSSPSAFTHLGLPYWFKVELTLAKVLGLLALW